MQTFKKNLKVILLFAAVISMQTMETFGQRSVNTDILYTGTFSLRGSKGIYVFQFDRSSGKLTEVQTVNEGSGPSFMDFSPGKKFLYAINGDAEGKVVAFSIDASNGFLTKINGQPSKGGPAHVSVDPKGRFVYVSNYGGGSLNVYPINKDGSLNSASDMIKYEGSGPNLQRQKAPHTHSAVPSKDGKFIYVSDLGTDKIMIYRVKKDGKLDPAATPFYKSTAGSGPRHFALHPTGRFAFSASELTSTITALRVNKSTGALTQIEELNMFPADFTGTTYAADIHVSPDGRFVYASNRGHDSLVIFAIDPVTGKLTLVGHESTGGKFPRNFLMDSKGEYVLAANQNSDNIVIFKRDKSTGKLNRIGEYQVPAPVCIQQL